MHGVPFRCQGNGGVSTAQSRHFVHAHFLTGMEKEADQSGILSTAIRRRRATTSSAARG